MVKIPLSSRFSVKFIPQYDSKGVSGAPRRHSLDIVVNVNENNRDVLKQNGHIKRSQSFREESPINEELFYESFEELPQPLPSPQYHELETRDHRASKKAHLSSYGMFPVASSQVPRDQEKFTHPSLPNCEDTRRRSPPPKTNHHTVPPRHNTMRNVLRSCLKGSTPRREPSEKKVRFAKVKNVWSYDPDSKCALRLRSSNQRKPRKKDEIAPPQHMPIRTPAFLTTGYN